jgi:hypothetical protein
MSIKRCIDCGSEPVHTIIDEVKPAFRMEIVSFACGALLKTIYGAGGSIGRISHEGCTTDTACHPADASAPLHAA